MNMLARDKTLLETIRQGLYLSAVQNTASTLGDRSKYIGVSEIAKYAECPRAAVAAKLGVQSADMKTLLTIQRGQWFENGIKNTIASLGLNSMHQLEINARRKSGAIKAHLDFALVWNKPISAVRILEIKSTERLPDEPWKSHVVQAQAQVDLLRHCWNKPVFALRNEHDEILHENTSFPAICKNRFGIKLSKRPSSISVESWIMYVSMKDAKAFGPYIHSPEKLEEMFIKADNFHQAIKAVKDNPAQLDELEYPKGFYPLCSWCEVNSDCPKFRQGDYQPQWESAIQKLDELKKRQDAIHAEINEIENALKQSYRLSKTKDWIDTGEHRFRMSMVSGRKCLNQEALKAEITEILHGFGSEIDVDSLFASCMKQGASFPRLTISTVN